MKRILSLGYSTCPNDTFVFHAMTHGLIDTRDLDFTVVHNDVEKLNRMAKERVLDISKLSFAALGRLNPDYGLLRSGSALGWGCGPLIVARPECDLTGIDAHPVAIPGRWTTANLLLHLYSQKPLNVVPKVFDEIMPSVASGEFTYGVIIHEGRFTYGKYGLNALLDLGNWWESETGLPIPLGCIAIRRALGPNLAQRVDTAIAQSVAHALDHPADSRAYVQQHAREMDAAVIDQHIDLYVNKQTGNLDAGGEAAVRRLLDKACDLKVIPRLEQPLFAY